MKKSTDVALLVDQLAGHWTEPALEMLKASSIHPISVDMEIATWRALKNALQAELRWQRAFRVSTLVSLSTIMEAVLRQAVILVGRTFEPKAMPHKFETEIRRAAAEYRATEAERRLYAEMVRRPELRAVFKLPSRSDFTPRLRISKFPR